jgi:hypothetical protein
VVAVREPEQRDGGREAVARAFLLRAERVAFALTDQGRRGEFSEMRGAQLLRAARRVEGIAEADEPGRKLGRR